MKTALVTGGSHGIGLAIALELLKDGYKVAIFSRRPEKALPLLTYFDPKNYMLIAGDALQPETYKDLIPKISEKLGTPNILINNVGGGGRWGSDKLLETKLETWKEVFQKNVWIAVELIYQILPYMLESNWGRVITVSSIHSGETGGRPWFSMAKSAENALMKTLSKDKTFVRKGITFNTISPGAILISNTAPKEFCDTLPMGRLGTPKEVAMAVRFLCSEESSFINGANIVIDGGESNRI